MIRLRSVENRVYRAVRDSRWARAAHSEPEAWDTAVLDTAKFCLLLSFRADGRPIGTPMWFGTAKGRVYLRSEARDAKIRRIANTPRVIICPCNVRGRPTGPTMLGHAVVLHDPGAVRDAEDALRLGNGIERRIYGVSRARLLDAAYIEVREPVGS